MPVAVTCQFNLLLPPEVVWNALKDVANVASCFPGVSRIEQVDDRACKGQVTVRLGPMQLEFAGQFTYTAVDDVALVATASAQGQDQRGRGRAQSKIRIHTAADGAGSVTTVQADTDLSGSVAQFGRAQSVIQAVAQTLISEFAKNLEVRLVHTGHEVEVVAVNLYAGHASASTSPVLPTEVDAPAAVNVIRLMALAFGRWFQGLFRSSGSS